jgi:hypothetical protein
MEEIEGCLVRSRSHLEEDCGGGDKDEEVVMRNEQSELEVDRGPNEIESYHFHWTLVRAARGGQENVKFTYKHD